MITTERTAIRRRLAIRRMAHGPPWRVRKARHGPIVAPLAATLATLALGVALAHAERGRRAQRRQRARERRFAPLPDERLGHGLRRMALGQLDVAIEALTGAGGSGKASPEARIHEARKALKRLRALLRLLRDGLGEQTYKRESALLRDTGRRLSGARDATVLLSTLDDLIERHPRELAARGRVRALRARLHSERERAAELVLADGAARAEAVSDLRALRARVEQWQLTDVGGIDAVEPALGRIYRGGQRRLRRAIKAKGARRRTRTLHEWRRRVKDLRYAAEMLGARKLAARADELGELLGEEHDLALLGDYLRSKATPGGPRALRRRTRKLLLRLIAKRRRKLRKRAMRKGKRLYEPKPKRFVRGVRKAALRTLSRR
jgi:CHAD domain-containing protein